MHSTASLFFMKKELPRTVQRALTGFASGVMVAASFFFSCFDHIIRHLHMNAEEAEGPKSTLTKTTMMVLAVTLHNITAGMAVGVVYAVYLSCSAEITACGALALSLGIAIQNFPEGAIISMHKDAAGANHFLMVCCPEPWSR